MRGKISKSSLHPTDNKNVWVRKRGWQINQERKKKSYKWKQGHQGVLPQRRVRWFISQAYYPSRAVSSGFTYKSNNAKFTWSRLSFTSFCYLNFTKRPQCNMPRNVLFFLVTSQTHLLKLQLHSVCACMWESVLPNQSNRSDAFTMSYLEHIFVEQPCPKHSDTICADDGVVPSQQIQGLYPLTVQVEGHRLVLNTVGYPVPSARRKGRVRIDG